MTADTARRADELAQLSLTWPSRAAAVATVMDQATDLIPATLDRVVAIYRAGRKAVAA